MVIFLKNDDDFSTLFSNKKNEVLKTKIKSNIPNTSQRRTLKTLKKKQNLFGIFGQS